MLAPLLPGLESLGCRVQRDDSSITITGPRGTVIAIRIGEKNLTIDGKVQPLALPARRVADEPFLPVRPLAEALGWAVRWHPDSRRLAIHGTVTGVKYTSLPDRQRVTVSATAPFTFSLGRLREPERIYVDLMNIDFQGPDLNLPVNESALLAVRAAQNSTDPDLVRVVLDVKEGTEITPVAADAGCTLNLDIPAAGLKGPGLATVLSVALGPYRAGMAEVVVTTSSGVNATEQSSADEKGRPQLVISIENILPGSAMPETSGAHPLVRSASLAAGPPSPNGSGTALLSLTLEKTIPHLMLVEPTGLRVLLGSMDLSELRIVVDPGHGGKQDGATGPSGLREKDVNLDITLRLRRLLESQGAMVIPTREKDDSLAPVANREQLRTELGLRAAVANDNNADMFISIHCNASDTINSQSGTQTYWRTPWSEPLARALHAKLVQVLKRKDAGIHTANFIVIKDTSCASVLLEIAYINNQEEEALLGDPRFRQRVAEAVVEGIESYLKSGAVLQSQLLKAAAMRAAAPYPSRHRLPPETRRPDAKSKRPRK
jgi:N-acetylmuramoyl-L-alanine amidase